GIGGISHRCIERRFDVADAQSLERLTRIPVVRRVDDGVVLAVGTVNRVEHQGAIFDTTADRAELVHRPRQRHGAGTRNASEGRTEPGCSATGGWRRNGTKGLTADRKPDEASGGG